MLAVICAAHSHIILPPAAGVSRNACLWLMVAPSLPRDPLRPLICQRPHLAATQNCTSRRRRDRAAAVPTSEVRFSSGSLLNHSFAAQPPSPSSRHRSTSRSVQRHDSELAPQGSLWPAPRPRPWRQQRRARASENGAESIRRQIVATRNSRALHVNVSMLHVSIPGRGEFRTASRDNTAAADLEHVEPSH